MARKEIEHIASEQTTFRFPVLPSLVSLWPCRASCYWPPFLLSSVCVSSICPACVSLGPLEITRKPAWKLAYIELELRFSAFI